MIKETKTNAMRILDAHGVSFEVLYYEYDENDFNAGTVAQKIGIPLERVFKTLAVRGAGGIVFLCAIPGDAELDLRKAALAAGLKSSELLALKELQPMTGYLRGACSPLGAKKKFQVFLEESAQLYERISVSAGMRGAQIVLSPEDLIAVAEAVYADLV